MVVRIHTGPLCARAHKPTDIYLLCPPSNFLNIAFEEMNCLFKLIQKNVSMIFSKIKLNVILVTHRFLTL